ncbi:MAG: tRNA threonylcarbamoyladenosine dehydratase [Prevotella sp.]|nr:tRNA threonylcarbamoyladenosine dehydratase [Prevotella sp.]MCM1476007.1 tRNA threonylcarbamoyladenosine dehydratase [Muribaculaceae bacterium]
MNDIDFFERSRMILGSEALLALSSARILIVGVGGVGSWCAEALIRSGAANLTIVDSDVVAASNVNRQIMATRSTIGHPKVDALRERLLQINPEAQIAALCRRFDVDSAESFSLESYDYIVDCIDSIKDKALLIEMATKTEAMFLSSMGAALKINPCKIQVAEFWKVKGCPLARAMRQRFKREKRYPAKKFQCVYGEERLSNRESGSEVANGSLMHITAIFGLTLAGLIINRIYNQYDKKL